MPNTPITNSIAVASVFSPFYLEGLLAVLSGTSGVASMLMPIAGFVWLVVQIIRAVVFWNPNKTKEK